VEAAFPLYRDGDVDGLLKNDDNVRCFQSRSTRLAGAAVFALIFIVGGVKLIGLKSHWSKPDFWSSCDQVLSTSSLTSLCGRRGAKNAVCTIARNNSYLFCNGQYWEKKSSSTSWVGSCRDGSCVAIWEDSRNCSTLEFEGWEDVCLGVGATDDDLANAECIRCQWFGALSCSGLEFRYNDGQYELSSLLIRNNSSRDRNKINEDYAVGITPACHLLPPKI
jgi:hypothetical protein